MGLPSKWSGVVWRGRQPEPTPSFTKSLLQFPPLSSRGLPPVAIHCAPRSEPAKPDTRTSRHDGLPRQTIVLLAMTECVVIARAEPVAIHCEPISEPTNPERFTSRHDGLPRPFVPRNDNVVTPEHHRYFFTPACPRDGTTRGDPLYTDKRTDQPRKELMLNRLPAYFLLLGLACQIGHAQRSGASFSILSESTGP